MPLTAVFSNMLMAALEVTVSVAVFAVVVVGPCLLAGLGARRMLDWWRARQWD